MIPVYRAAIDTVTRVAAYEWINDPKQTIRKLKEFACSTIFSTRCFGRTQIHHSPFVVHEFFIFNFSYRKIQESSSSHSIPHVALSSADAKTPSLSYSVSNAMDVGNFSGAHSSSTPQFKKKMLGDKQTATTSRDDTTSGHIAKHQSFDYSKSRRHSFDIYVKSHIKCEC